MQAETQATCYEVKTAKAQKLDYKHKQIDPFDTLFKFRRIDRISNDVRIEHTQS